MIAPGQICRDRTRSTFRVVIVLGPSQKGGKLRVCRWQPPPSAQVDGRWSAPCAVSEDQLEPITADFDLTTRLGQVVSAAKRSVVGGIVRWQIGGPYSGFTELHVVGTVRP